MLLYFPIPLNLYYPRDIHWIGIEPNTYVYPYLQQEAERVGLNIDIRSETAEQSNAEDNSIDVVVSALVLCSVENLSTVLQEILRVLAIVSPQIIGVAVKKKA
ncbi:MAG: class I SAM-dependent methyltransferase [Pleurocapsa sp.]